MYFKYMESLNNFFQEEIGKRDPLFYISEFFQCVVNPNDSIDFTENDFDDPTKETTKTLGGITTGGLELSTTITKSECEALGEGPLMNDNHKNVFRTRVSCFSDMIMNYIFEILKIAIKLGKTNMNNECINLDIHGSDSGSSQKIIDNILSSIIVIRLTTGDIYKNCRYWVVAKSEVCELIKNHDMSERITYNEKLKYPHGGDSNINYVCTLDNNIDIYEDKINDADQKTSNVCVGINPGFYSKPVKNGIVINLKNLVDNVVFQPNFMGILTNSFDVKLKMNSMFNVLVLGDHPEVNYCAFTVDKINTVKKIKNML